MNEELRTVKQNSSLHGTLDAYAAKLNDAGYDYIDCVHSVKLNGFAVSWTKHNMKGFFDAVTKAMFGGRTSSQLTKIEIQQAYKVFEERFSEMSGVSHRWHSLEKQLLESDNGWWK